MKEKERMEIIVIMSVRALKYVGVKVVGPVVP